MTNRNRNQLKMPSVSDKLRELAVKLFEIEAIRFGDYELGNGLRTPIYIDLHSIPSYPIVYVS